MKYIQTQISRELGQDLSSLLDDFQEVVNTGNTTSRIDWGRGIYNHSRRSNRKSYVVPENEKYLWELRGEKNKKVSRSPSFRKSYDPKPIPLDTYDRTRWNTHIEEILMTSPITDRDKELVWEFLVRGGDLDGWRYGEMDHSRWWRMTKGLLWKFYNYLDHTGTYGSKLRSILTDLIFDLTSVKGSRSQQGDDFEYKTLQELYDPELEKEVQELNGKIGIEEMKIYGRVRSHNLM